MAQFLDFLSRVAIALTQSSIKYVIVGSTVAILRGRVRTTGDIDIIIENNLEKFRSLIDLLKNNGCDVADEQVHYSLEEGFNLSIFDTKSVMRIDLKFAKKQEDLDALEGAITEIHHNLELRLANIEQFLFGKALYLGDISDLTDFELLKYNDVMDFITICQIFESKFDYKKLQLMAKQHNISKTLNRLMKMSSIYNHKK